MKAALVAMGFLFCVAVPSLTENLRMSKTHHQNLLEMTGAATKYRDTITPEAAE